MIDKRTTYELVKEFHRTFGVPELSSAGFPDNKRRALRLELIEEEFHELLDAEDEDNLVEVADALSDLSYVIAGMALEYGIDLDACVNEVHRSNMSKLGADGRPIYRDDGKVIKGPNYSPPDLTPFVRAE
jgi:predicted HAD superfamily Cof-like phosphohydrolase